MEYKRLLNLVYEGAHWIYGEQLPVEVSNRIEFELDIISQHKGWVDYLLVVYEYTHAAQTELGLWMSPGRGSACGSIVNYCLGITQIDPLKYNLLFERFVNYDHQGLPDIDIDVEENGRDRLRDWIFEHFGWENCAHIRAFFNISKSSKRIYKEGIHACGLVISKSPIKDITPIVEEDVHGLKAQVIVCDGHQLDKTGLIKYDILGFRCLNQMKDIYYMIKETYGVEIDLHHLPDNDEATLNLFRQGDTEDVFMFCSESIQEYLRELKPTCFNDLVAFNALYRPGAMDFLPEFIKRKNEWYSTNGEPEVRKFHLRDTYGLLVFQEQLMLMAQLIADLTPTESDDLRRAMGKKKVDTIESIKPKFMEGGWRNGFETAELEAIWNEWFEHSLYLFNKSHAVAYTMIAYQMAYLKAHYPKEFHFVMDAYKERHPENM